MNKIVFATNNKHKLEEIRSILGEDFEVLSLSDIGCHEDIPETSDTLEGNAMQKAQYVFDKYGYACFADDTGLEVEALGGEPGIYSARYAALDGDDSISHDSEANMAKLLRKLEGIENRKARFRTVIALITNAPLPFGEGMGERLQLFEGIVNGSIIRERRGGEGFGYDPIFQPEGYDKTFAELGNEVKNHISHRARAVQKLADYLKSY
jgi:XTP/dITP diphosphohydrolase